MEGIGILPSETLNQRRQFLNTMKAFVEEQSRKLQETLKNTGYQEDLFRKVRPGQVCPYNPDHIVPEDKFKKHTEVCKLRSAGCQEDELEALLQNTDFFYHDCDKILKIEIDEPQLNKIIWDHCVQTGQVYTGHRTLPTSHIDENVLLTQEDRLAVYKHVVAKSHEAGKVIPVDKTDELLTTDWSALVKKGLLDEQNSQGLSKLEQLAALRDMKRRRQSYRAKNVHITKKSYKEIIREVIANQMEILNPPTQDKQDLDKGFESSMNQTSKSRHSYRSRSQSPSSSQNRSSHRNRYEDDRLGRRDRERERHRDRSPRRDLDRRRERSRDRDRGRDREDDRQQRKERKDKTTERDFEEETEQSLEGKESGEYKEKNLKVEVKEEIFSDHDTSQAEDMSRKRERERRKRCSRSSSSEGTSDSGDDDSRSRHKSKRSKRKKKNSKRKHKRKD